MKFIDDFYISSASWQGFERLISRLLVSQLYDFVSVVGRTGDGGADVLATKNGKRWLFQVKHVNNPVGSEVLNRTVAAAKSYQAQIPVVVSKSGFTADVQTQRSRLAAEGINIQIWDSSALVRYARKLPESPPILASPRHQVRTYQEAAIKGIVAAWVRDRSSSALVVLATGLGKTFVASEAIRRISASKNNLRVLVLAHTNDLLYQLERSFWPFLTSSQATVIVNGVERPEYRDLANYTIVFISRDTLAGIEKAAIEIPQFDIVMVDECHHLEAETYERGLGFLRVGNLGGPFLLGLTATPWRPGGQPLKKHFGDPVISIDLVQGLNSEFLANVDYRVFTDNVNWEELHRLKGARFTPKAINRTLFINQWDDAVVERIHEAWIELGHKARGIVFCGTIDHAEKVSDRINALGFTHAKPIYSQSSAGKLMTPVERNRLLWDFADSRIGILCAVDVLNEGIDVPDVNLVVFQRVTHSRRIFVQQLGRGLRLAAGKEKVIVLDFVSDIRRFAANLDLQRSLTSRGDGASRVSIGSKVSFKKANSSDQAGESFLREWLGDLTEVEEAGEDVSVLRYPPLEALPARTRGA